MIDTRKRDRKAAELLKKASGASMASLNVNDHISVYHDSRYTDDIALARRIMEGRPAASVFYDRQTIEDEALQQVLAEDTLRLADWLVDDAAAEEIEMYAFFDESIGYGFKRGAYKEGSRREFEKFETDSVKIVFKKLYTYRNGFEFSVTSCYPDLESSSL